MTQSHTDLIRNLVPLWHAQMAWAKALLVNAFGLKEAQDILSSDHRGKHQVPGTIWFIRTHGVGVDIYKTPEVGGIDFDFDKPNPDAWRLKIFFEKQLNDGVLPYAQYRDLIDDEELLDKTIQEVLQSA